MGNGTRLRTSVHGDEFACGAQQESPKGGAVPTRCLAVRHATLPGLGRLATDYKLFKVLQHATYDLCFLRPVSLEDLGEHKTAEQARGHWQPYESTWSTYCICRSHGQASGFGALAIQMSGFPGYATVESSLIICTCNARVLGCALPFKTQKELALETLYSPSPHLCAQDFDTFTVGSRGMIYEPICEEQQAPCQHYFAL